MPEGQLGFCAHCNSEVPAAPNTHRTRNTAAASVAAANLALVAPPVRDFGPTCRYVCAYCGGELKVASPARPRPPR